LNIGQRFGIDHKGPVDVLLVNANNRQGLAAARSLARRGVSFIMVSNNAEGPASHSRLVKNEVLAADLKGEALVDLLLEIIRQYQIPLAMPASDQALVLFDRYRSALEGETKLAMANPQAVKNVLDKRRNLELARRLGVPCPLQFELQDTSQIPEMIQLLGFPIVLKGPGVPNGPGVPEFNFKVLYAHTEQQLRGYIEEHCWHGKYPMFQECAVGNVHNLCCFAAQGELIAVHEYHSIRRKDGVGVLRKIVAPLPDLVEHTRNLLRELNWDGVAHVAFFISHDGKKKWYMETNGRFWASTEGSVHAGWDFPYWVYRYFLYGEKPVPGEIEIGSTTCWHYGDLMALLKYFRGGESPTTGTSPGKLRALGQYLSDFSPGVHSDVFHWNDPMPGITEHLELAPLLWRSLKKRMSRPFRTVQQESADQDSGR
jgi:predicted ATP-grasp superfamily ATP-dependent carboligase